MEASIEKITERLESAERVFFLTGAGISAESGVPTFRGGGTSLVWRGMPFEQLSSAEMVRTNLPLVWEWFDHRLGIMQECLPNAGHYAIANAQKSGRFSELVLATQNIDGLHRAAGSAELIELHGNINEALCPACGMIKQLAEFEPGERPPICLNCREPMRPNVVLFGEMLDQLNIENAWAAAEKCDVCFVVGTSALVYPAADLPRIAKQNGALIIEINPEQTILTPTANISIRSTSANILSQIFSE